MRKHLNFARPRLGLIAGTLAASLIVCVIYWFIPSEEGHMDEDASGKHAFAATATNVFNPGASQTGASHRELVGIGTALVRPNVENGVVQIDRVLPGSPAERAGLKRGMNIHKVDGVSVLRFPLSETVARMRGPEGSTLQLELSEGIDGALFTIEVSREKLKL